MTHNILEGAFIPTPTQQDFRIVTQLLTRFGFPRLEPIAWNRYGGLTYVRTSLQYDTKVAYAGGYGISDMGNRVKNFPNPQDFVIEYMPRVPEGDGVKASKIDYVQINSNSIMSETYGQAKIDLDPQSMYVMGYDVDENLGPVYRIGLKGAPRNVGFAVKFADLHREMGERGKYEYAVGTAVKLSESSEFYRPQEDHNPIGMLGEVVDHYDTHNPYYIRVKWLNGECNAYSPADLVNYGTFIGVGDVVKPKANQPVIKSTDERSYAAHIFGERKVDSVNITSNEILFKLKGDSNLTFNSRHFDIVTKAKDVKVDEIETSRKYKLIKTWPGGPVLGTISTQDQSQFPEFWEPTKEFETSSYIYLTNEVKVNDHLKLGEGSILRIEECENTSVKTFGDFLIPIGSFRLATETEVREKSIREIAGHNVVYLGNGVGVGDQFLYEEELQAIKTLMNQRFNVSIEVDGDEISFEDYFYLHMFSGLPYNKE